MAVPNNYALLWSDDGFILAETTNNVSARTIPISVSSQQIDGSDLKDDLHLTAILQKTLREARIETKKVHLAIPARDTIIRSFVLPVMNANELQPAIEFEAKKYIPFSLKDLYYSFYSVNITENKIKKLRIIFVAVKKELIDRSSNIILSTGMNVAYVEPSAVGLWRALLAKKIVSKDQSVVVLNMSKTTCLAVFIQEGVVFYIREFQFVSVGADKSVQDAQDVIKMRLLNEMHNSLDFYNRHYMQPKITQMIIVSSKQEYPYDMWMKEDLNVPVKMIDAGAVIQLNQAQHNEIGMVEAFGNALAYVTKIKAEFNLLKKSGRSVATDTVPFGLSLTNLLEFKDAIKVLAISVVLLGGAYFLMQTTLSRETAKVDEIKNAQIKYADYSKDDLQIRLDKLKTRLKAQKNTPFKSPVEPVFVSVAALMPEGFWLSSFELNLVTKMPTPGGTPSQAAASDGDKSANAPIEWQMRLNGNVYLKDPSQGIRVINNFLTALKKDKRLLKYFSKFNLGEISVHDIHGVNVTTFSIVGTTT